MNTIAEKQYLKYYPLLAILIITAQLAATTLANRTMLIGPFLLPGGIWSFPLTFFLWDIVTEIYGFKRARQLIWYYLIGQLFFAALINIGLRMHPAPVVQQPQIYSEVLGNIYKLTLSMILAIWAGDYVNCYVLDKLKAYTNGKYLWMRLIGSTAIGELVTSFLWVIVYYTGQNHHPDMLKLIISQYFIKILFELAFVPLTYLIVIFLRKNEVVDLNKRYINFNPYTLEKFEDS